MVMPRYADWVETLPGYRVFAAAPIIFDGLWMDHYLSTFAGTRVLGGPFRTRQIFRGGGVCFGPGLGAGAAGGARNARRLRLTGGRAAGPVPGGAGF